MAYTYCLWRWCLDREQCRLVMSTTHPSQHNKHIILLLLSLTIFYTIDFKGSKYIENNMCYLVICTNINSCTMLSYVPNHAKKRTLFAEFIITEFTLNNYLFNFNNITKYLGGPEPSRLTRWKCHWRTDLYILTFLI